MDIPDNAETPSQTLARQIVTRLVKERLIGERATGTLTQQLADGKLRAEDWRLPIELGGDKEGKQ